MNKSKRAGVAVSYVNILLNMAVNIFFTPFLLRSLGDAEYGVYKIIHSFSGQLSIMSFGLSTVVARNIVHYNTKNELEKKQNFLFMANVISSVLFFLVIAVGGILFLFIDGLYQNSLSSHDLQTAKILFVLMIINTAFTIFGDSYSGIIRGHELFALSYLTKTFKIIGRVALIILLINLGLKSVAIVSVDLFLTVCVVIFDIVFSRVKLKERPKFQSWDKEVMKTTFLFSSAVFLQAIVNSVNQNMDGVILGAMTNPDTVTMYSLGLTIFVTYSAVTNVISGVFTPQATKLVYSGASSEQLTDFVIRPGRVQLALAGAIVGGFILYGKSFITAWVGEEYVAVYPVILLLIIPAVIPVIISVSNAILDAKMLRMGRSLILFAMAVINVVISIILVHYIGYIGAAIGTALSYIVGQGVMTSIYLKKRVGLNIGRMYLNICKGIFPCIIITTLTLIPTSIWFPDGWFGLILKAVSFLSVYVVLMYFIGFDKNERKSYIQNPINNVTRLLTHKFFGAQMK